MQQLNEIKTILSNVFDLGERKNSLTPDSILLGNIPEFDSVTVVTLIVALEEHFNIKIENDEITAQTFDTLTSLTQFIEQKTTGHL
ncbi:MAG: acyl carrier protein [Nitrosomonas sp.]|nr:acyl carrier protein [Nitrosomonas sp.]MDP1950141.1 acyl carrier protein [Nitrosomonas sp.]